MTVMEIYHPEGISPSVSSPRQVSTLRKIFNVLGCLISLPIYWVATIHCRWPVTLDLILTIALAELNRYVNEGRRQEYYDAETQPPPYYKEKGDPEKMIYEVESTPKVDCMAAVVGWREDPALFKSALQSYRKAQGCCFLLVGIDGDEEDDQDMVDVFHEVRCSLKAVGACR